MRKNLKQIQKLRQQCGISQAALAQMIGVTSSTVAKWETAEVYPRAQLLPKIAEILKCSIDELFEGCEIT